MLRGLTILALFIATIPAIAQQMPADTSATGTSAQWQLELGDLPRNEAPTEEKPSPGETLKAWKFGKMFADTTRIEPDTLADAFQLSSTPVYKKTIAAEWLGNLGLPAQSAILQDRHQTSLTGDYIFRNPYLPYINTEEDVIFYNSRVPYSNISYYTGGGNEHAEDHLYALLSINANQRLSFGLFADYLYGRGLYHNQSSDGLSGALTANYLGERYQMAFIAGLNNFRNFENGGLQNDADLNTPQSSADNYLTRLPNSGSSFRSFYFWMNHRYSVGYEKRDSLDSEKFEFVPVMTFGYTAKFEGSRKKYLDNTMPEGFYDVYNYSHTQTSDTTSNNMFRNIFSVTMNEGFRKWAVFGLRAFAEVDVESNMMRSQVVDSIYNHDTRVLVSVGGELYKRHGIVQYGVLGEALVLGADGRFAFNVEGDFKTEIPIKNETLVIKADGYVKSTNPSYYTEHYYSNHFAWENTFSNTFSASGGGSIGIPNKYCNFEAGANWYGVRNYIYFDKSAMPAQTPDFIQVISGKLKCDLHIKFFNWENEARVQYSSNSEIMPLPLVSVYSNLYFKWKFFKKLLTFEIGVDCRYNTAYYANAYMPATGQFYLQDEVEVGNFPVMSVYINAHLKMFRAFVMIYNMSDWFMPPQYFTTPHYPLNPVIFKAGLSWNFYN